MTISFSQIHAFKTCPKKYHLKQELGVNLDAPGAHVGKIVHEILDAYQSTDRDLEQIVNSKAFYASTDEIKDIKQIINFIKNDLSKCKNCQTELKLAIDYEGKGVDFDSDKALLRGIIDKIDFFSDKEAVITDYKTNRFENADELQLDLYALMAFANFPELEKITAQFEYLRLGRVVSKTYSADDIVYFESVLESLRLISDEMQKNNQAIVGDHCRFCPFTNVCEEYKTFVEKTGFEKIETIDDLKQAILKNTLLNAEKQKVSKAIKAFLETNGEVNEDDVVLRYSESVRKNINLSKLLEYGIELPPDVKIPATQLKGMDIPEDAIEEQKYFRMVSKIGH